MQNNAKGSTPIVVTAAPQYDGVGVKGTSHSSDGESGIARAPDKSSVKGGLDPNIN